MPAQASCSDWLCECLVFITSIKTSRSWAWTTCSFELMMSFRWDFGCCPSVPGQFLVNIAQMLQTQKGLRYLRIRQFAHIFPSSCSHGVLAAYFWWNKSAISHQSFSAEQSSHILNMYNSVLTRSIGPKVGFSITVLSFLFFAIIQIDVYIHKLCSTLYSFCKMKIEWLLFIFFASFISSDFKKGINHSQRVCFVLFL